MSEIHITREYPQPIETVWRALTDPAIVPRWTATGAGGRPEGFQLVAGSTFRFVGRPKPGWNGIVNCQVLEVSAPSLLGRVRRRMLDTGLPPVLDSLAAA
jgi:uncharacterized protein YndB with AHSA1/START domain